MSRPPRSHCPPRAPPSRPSFFKKYEGLTAAESAAIVNEVRSLFRGGVAAAAAEEAALQRAVHRQVEAVADAELMALAQTSPWLLGVGHAPMGPTPINGLFTCT